MILTDIEREQIISVTRQLAERGSQAMRRYWWEQMRELINSRSPEQVRRMEIAQGLRAA